MEIVTNYVSKVLIKDTEVPYCIVTYIDIGRKMTEDEIHTYINTVVNKNDILQKQITNINENLYLKPVDKINISDYYTIEDLPREMFDKQIEPILNTPITTDLYWRFFVYISSTETRIVFKIHHAYADGYRIIKILTSPYTSDDITKTFSRQTCDALYYSVFGTLFMVYVYITYIFSIITSSQEFIQNSEPTDFIKCNSLSLKEVKTITNSRNITVNDFLYALAVRSQYYYTFQQKVLFSISPLNLTNTSEMNNMVPLFFNTLNTLPPNELLNDVHEMFNSAKYSLFIPLLSILLNTFVSKLPLQVLSSLYTKCTNNADFIYSNIIGPSKIVNPDIKHIHFLTTAKQNELIFNIISFEDEINIICSFKKGVIQDKERLKKCISLAYKELMMSKA